MRLQHVSVVFIMIFIPIIIVTSYFINLQVNTIKIESSYDEKLLNATYDAMTAFELNTANEDLSSVSDSLRSIIEASNNIFFNTLCTNLGISNASKSFVQPYIPAILYTLYDGYYIYSPTNIPEICVDKYGRTIRTSDYGVKYSSTKSGIGIYEFSQDAIKYSDVTTTEPEGLNAGYTAYVVNYTTLDDAIKPEYGQILYKNNDGTYSVALHSWAGAKSSEEYKKSTYYKRDYILKSYIPYAATYSNTTKSIDITINYTLDNFMTIEGMVNGVYYTKSGYFIDQSLISSIVVDTTTLDAGTSPDVWKTYSDDVLSAYIHDPANHEVKVVLNDGLTISNQDGKVMVSNGTGAGSVARYWDDAQSAVEYYVKSYIFSKWVHTNLNEVQANNLKNTQYSVSDIQNSVFDDLSASQTVLYKDMLHNFSSDTSLPFIGNDNDPESEESPFYEHKRRVIKNSITYNLMLSMLVYTEESRTVEFNMPVFDEGEWTRILNNVSIVSFMEGMRCGLKYYNNYAIVTSTNNEISVTDNEIYYVPRVLQEIDSSTHAQIIARLDDDETDYPVSASLPHPTPPENETAHRVDCEKLILGETNNFYDLNSDGSLTRDEWLGCYSFKSKEIKYDKILNTKGQYLYDHKVYTDYNCIVDSNYTVRNVNNTKEDGNTDVLEYLRKNVDNAAPADTVLHKALEYKLLAYRIGVAKERNNLYKTTAFPENYGWKVLFFGEGTAGKQLTKAAGKVDIDVSSLLPAGRKISEIKKIEVTYSGAVQGAAGIYTSDVSAKFNDSLEYTVKQTVSTTSASRRTIEFVQDFSSADAPTKITISAPNIEFYVESIKVYYK